MATIWVGLTLSTDSDSPSSSPVSQKTEMDVVASKVPLM